MDGRAAIKADIPALLSLIESAYRGDASRTGWTTEADLLDGQRIDREMLAAIIADRAQRLMLFEVDDQPVACVNIEKRDGYAYVGLVTVSPAAQAQGWGRRLLAVVESIAADDWQLDRARMSVIRQRTDLIAWYVRHGYGQTGETLPFPYGDERFGRPRRDDLEFVILEKQLGTASPQPLPTVS